MKRRAMRLFESNDGTRWGVEATLPGSSNLMIMFHHPGGRTARLDRYAWHVADVPEARSVTSRLDPAGTLGGIDDDRLGLLFRRSMLISAPDDRRVPA